MVENQGLIVGMTMIIGFFAIAGFSIHAVVNGNIEVATLIQLYEGLGKVAAMTGIPVILGVYIGTRGQTSGSG